MRKIKVSWICKTFLLCFVYQIQPQLAQANVISVDTQNFNPTYNGLDFVTVQSSETLAPGVFNLGLFLNYAVNTLPYYSEPGAGEGKDSRLGKVRDSLLSTDLSFGLGLTSWWDVGLSFPFMVKQTVNSDDSRGEFAENGLTEVRLATKVRLLGNHSQGLGLVFSSNFNMIENNPFVGSGGGPIFNAEIVGDILLLRRIALGMNIGYRSRNPGKPLEDFPIEPTKDQYIASVAASYLFRSIDTKLILEAFGSAPVSESSSQVARHQSSAEALLGIKHDVNSNVALHFGAGTELDHSYASPDWRIYLGTNMTLGPIWGDNDKIVERKVKKVRQRTRPPETDQPEQDLRDLAAIGATDGPVVEEQDIEMVVPGEEYPSDADETFVLKDIYFAFDSDFKALPGARALLEQVANRIKAKKFKKMIVEGHTDSMGSYKYNIDLGKRRALMVRSYLINQFGLDRKKVYIDTYGETRPIGDNGNYQGRQLNRRVVFRIYYK